jgi:hypothetical protein
MTAREITDALIADKAPTATRKQAIDIQAAILASMRKRDGGTVLGEGSPARRRLAETHNAPKLNNAWWRCTRAGNCNPPVSMGQVRFGKGSKERLPGCRIIQPCCRNRHIFPRWPQQRQGAGAVSFWVAALTQKLMAMAGRNPTSEGAGSPPGISPPRRPQLPPSWGRH